MFLSETLEGFNINVDITGTYVKHKSIAPIKAKLKVNAIGLNIFPSTPLKDSIGIKTIRINQYLFIHPTLMNPVMINQYFR